MSNELILSWKNPYNNKRVPIGRLYFKDDYYCFRYTKGALNEKEFRPFDSMDRLDRVYQSKELFPMFKNRLLQKSRPEYKEYLGWLNIKTDSIHPMEELALTGGVRATDSFELYPLPQEKEGNYVVSFFSRGIRHLAKSYNQRIEGLGENRKLYLMRDIQNKLDGYALVLRTDNPIELVGYCPSFYTKDFNRLIENNGANDIFLRVVKNNLDAPSQLKLLCEFQTKWSNGFTPFDSENFQLI
ncbi:hypothetical protein MNB_SV-13-223 [hydrothermal vent metagenome]|uniref:HIRAN domain-containing protein n=1 Tax=hydrothermal vent metagenome TaxID=652676 RepID=A0A1W1D0C5_9ZZZZ